MVPEGRHLTLWNVAQRKPTCEGIVIGWVMDGESQRDQWLPVVAKFGDPVGRPVWDVNGYEIRREDIHNGR